MSRQEIKERANVQFLKDVRDLGIKSNDPNFERYRDMYIIGFLSGMAQGGEFVKEKYEIALQAITQKLEKELGDA